MNRKIKIGVKFCGHCNPNINGPELIRSVIETEKRFSCVPWDDIDKDALLIIGGCPINCATRPEFNGPTTEMAAEASSENEAVVQTTHQQLLGKIEELINIVNKEKQ